MNVHNVHDYESNWVRSFHLFFISPSAKIGAGRSLQTASQKVLNNPDSPSSLVNQVNKLGKQMLMFN